MPDYQEPDYKELYLKLFRATEETINRLIEVQQQCEELYLAAGDHETDGTGCVPAAFRPACRVPC